MTSASVVASEAKETTTRVYRYRLFLDRSSIEAMVARVRTANRMFNDLADAMNEVLRERELVIAAAQLEHARLQDELSYVDRRKNPNFSGVQRVSICSRLRALLKEERVAREVYREADGHVAMRWKEVRARVNRVYSERLCWTHRGLIDRAVETAAKGRKIEGSKVPVRTWGYRIRPRDLDDDVGMLGGQTFVNKGCDVRDVWNFGSSRQRVLCIGDGIPVSLPSARAARRRKAHQSFSLRISESEYITGKLVLHRELPSEGTIKEIRISRAKEGRYQRHHIILTVTGIPKVDLGHEVASHHLGWSSAEADETEPTRLTAGAIAGPGGTMLLTPPGLEQFDWCENLQADTDKALDVLRDGLWAEVSALPEVPGHLTHLARWRSPQRLMDLANDSALTPQQRERVAAWAYHHRHRIDAIASARANALRTRDQYYHGMVRNLIRHGVGTLVVEHGVLATFSRREKGEVGRRWQKQRMRVSSSSVKMFAASAGMRIVEVEPAYTSQCCSHCGAVHEKSRSQREFVCVACGACEHVETNAARMLRSAFCERVHDEIPAVIARAQKKPSRGERFAEARRRTRESNGAMAAE